MLRKLFRRFAEKNKQKLTKKFCVAKKNFTDFQVFLWKKELKKAFFEVFLRNFNADKSDNQACFFFHES
jgi:hypothetical protein